MSNPVILVIGMHRSGTSMCSNILHSMGADMAEAAYAAPENARGHWERPRLVDTNDAIFGFFRRPWNAPSHVLDMPERWVDDPRVQDLRAKAVLWLKPQLRPDRPFGFKDPRTTLLLEFWRQVFGDAGAAPHYVFCVRDPAQVARSLSARDGMDRGQAEYRWLSYNIEAVRAVAGLPVCIIPYEHWFERRAETAARLAAHVGLPTLPADALAAVIDLELRHDGAIPPAAALSRRLHRAILANAGRNRIGPALRDLVGLLGEMKKQVQPLLVDSEALRAGVVEQRRVIGDLQLLVKQLRADSERAPLAGR